jgi:uncharacterized phiE125 gp8 family phage protein
MLSILVQGPAQEPVDVHELKADLKLDDDEDLLLSSLITSARMVVEANTGVRLVSQSWDLIMDNWPQGGDDRICLPHWPVQDITGIYLLGNGREQVDQTVYESELNPRIPQVFPVKGRSWPAIKRDKLGVLVSLTAGFISVETIPEPLKQAIRLLAVNWYEARDWQSSGNHQKIPSLVESMITPYRNINL